MKQIRGNDFARFWSKVERQGDCLVWIGYRDQLGYGKFITNKNGKQTVTVAHRWIFSKVFGIADWEVVRHQCHNRGCVNLLHLESGTQKENMNDMVLAGRCGKSAKIDETVAQGIVNALDFGIPNWFIEKAFNTTRGVVSCIKNIDNRWGHVRSQYNRGRCRSDRMRKIKHDENGFEYYVD